MKNDLVLRAIDGPIARLTLNNPVRANVLSEAMMVALDGALAEAAADQRVRVIVLENLASLAPVRESTVS